MFGFWGALVDFFLTSSSRDMAATVLSNAALEKKAISIPMVPYASNKGIGEKNIKRCTLVSWKGMVAPGRTLTSGTVGACDMPCQNKVLLTARHHRQTSKHRAGQKIKAKDDDSYASADLPKARVGEHHPNRVSVSQKALFRSTSASRNSCSQ